MENKKVLSFIKMMILFKELVTSNVTFLQFLQLEFCICKLYLCSVNFYLLKVN